MITPSTHDSSGRWRWRRDGGDRQRRCRAGRGDRTDCHPHSLRTRDPGSRRPVDVSSPWVGLSVTAVQPARVRPLVRPRWVGATSAARSSSDRHVGMVSGVLGEPRPDLAQQRGVVAASAGDHAHAVVGREVASGDAVGYPEHALHGLVRTHVRSLAYGSRRRDPSVVSRHPGRWLRHRCRHASPRRGRSRGPITFVPWGIKVLGRRRKPQRFVPTEQDFADARSALIANRSAGRVNVGRGVRTPSERSLALRRVRLRPAVAAAVIAAARRADDSHDHGARRDHCPPLDGQRGQPTITATTKTTTSTIAITMSTSAIVPIPSVRLAAGCTTGTCGHCCSLVGTTFRFDPSKPEPAVRALWSEWAELQRSAEFRDLRGTPFRWVMRDVAVDLGAHSQPIPSPSRSRSNTSGPTTVTRPVYLGPLPDPPMQS